MMEVLDRFRLDQKVETVKEDPVQRQILRIILKYEMQSLVNTDSNLEFSTNLLDCWYNSLLLIDI